MADVALTTIQHGTDDGDVVVIREGDEVKGLPKEVVADLKEQGLIGEPAATPAQSDDEKKALKARIAELEGQLADANKEKPNDSGTGQTSTPTPPTPPAK